MKTLPLTKPDGTSGIGRNHQCRYGRILNIRPHGGGINNMDVITNPWFVGIAATVVGGLILHYVFGVGRTKRIKSSPPKQPEDNSVKKSVMKNLTPRKIMYDDLGRLPPLQRDSAAQNYKGIKVSWKVCFYNASLLGNGKLHLMMLNPGGNYPWIYCDVNPEEYPQLRIMKSEEKFVVEGEIESIEHGGIVLRNVKLLL